MPALSIDIPAGIATRVLDAASAELGVPAAATQAQKLDAVKQHLKSVLVGLVRKHEIDQGRVTGEQTATAGLPDFSTIT